MLLPAVADEAHIFQDRCMGLSMAYESHENENASRNLDIHSMGQVLIWVPWEIGTSRTEGRF
jgi:hypothetical protein